MLDLPLCMVKDQYCWTNGDPVQIGLSVLLKKPTIDVSVLLGTKTGISVLLGTKIIVQKYQFWFPIVQKYQFWSLIVQKYQFWSPIVLKYKCWSSKIQKYLFWSPIVQKYQFWSPIVQKWPKLVFLHYYGPKNWYFCTIGDQKCYQTNQSRLVQVDIEQIVGKKTC
jgi:hypothetical protein